VKGRVGDGMQRIILSYGGGPAADAAVRCLAGEHHAEVVAVTTDHGQPVDLEPVREQALAAGAVRAHVLDMREAFAGEYLLPALQAGVLHDDPELALALDEALVARALVEVAAMEGAAAVAHARGLRPGEPDALAAAVRALAPGLRVEAVRTSEPAGGFAAEGNLWVRRIAVPAGSNLDEAPAAAFVLTQPPAKQPAEHATLDVEFTRGVPSSINGVAVPFLELIDIVTTIAGDHGIGRRERLDLQRPGERIVAESPAGAVLGLAHAALEAAAADDDLRAVKRACSLAYRDLVTRGRWFSPAREAIDALVGRVQAHVSGAVRLKLWRGGCHVTAVRPHAPAAVAPPHSLPRGANAARPSS
jgi:argininosuccinate synthase